MDADRRLVVERRAARRYDGVACDEITVRIRPGHAARLRDISTDGALVQTSCRLMPGTWIDIQLRIGQTAASTRAQVLRASIAHLTTGGIVFAGALRFAMPLSWAGEMDAPAIAQLATAFPPNAAAGTAYSRPPAAGDHGVQQPT